MASLEVNVGTGKVTSLPCWWHHISRFRLQHKKCFITQTNCCCDSKSKQSCGLSRFQLVRQCISMGTMVVLIQKASTSGAL